MSKVAAAITSPATKVVKQENSTKSLRSIRIRAPSPLLRGLVWHPKGWLWQKLGLEGIVSKRLALPLCLRPLTALAQVQEPGSPRSEARGRRALAKEGIALISCFTVRPPTLPKAHPPASNYKRRHPAHCPRRTRLHCRLLKRRELRGQWQDVGELTKALELA